MRHKLIRNIKTRIYKRRQLVIIEFDNNEFVFLAPNNIRQNTSLEVFELELLVGSTLRLEFYKKGEKMFNGKLCDKDNLIVKEYFFELSKPADVLRSENASILLPFEKIIDIFYFTRSEKENVGLKVKEDKVIYISLKRFEGFSRIEKSEQHILIGSYICPEYYKQGEKLRDGSIVKKSNTLLKTINLRYSNTIESMHENFENGISYYDGDEYASENGPEAHGYDSWEDMAFEVAFEGDVDAWNHYNQ